MQHLLEQRQLVRVELLAPSAVDPPQEQVQAVGHLPDLAILGAQHFQQLSDHLLENGNVFRKCSRLDIHVAYV